MCHKLRRPVHDLLQHRLEPSALGRVANGRNLAGQAQLAKEAQAVVGECPQMQDHVVGVELARRQPFQIKVRFDLGMELFVCAVIPVVLDHLHSRQGEARPPAFDLNVRHQQVLSLLVDGALGHPHDQPEGALLFLPGALDLEVEKSHPLAWSGHFKGVRFLGPLDPGRSVLLSWVPLRDEFQYAPRRRVLPLWRTAVARCQSRCLRPSGRVDPP